MVREKTEEVLCLIRNIYKKQFVIRDPESLNSIPALWSCRKCKKCVILMIVAYSL